jgi:holo-[acyl-carrier protein] synthase
MILGIGSDLVDIRLFTEGERRRCDRRAARAEGYARRFAAKEACAKALGTGFRQGVYWRDLEVINLPTGQPGMRLSGQAAAHLARLTPPGMQPAIHVSLTDDPPMAQAIVIISAVAPRA